MYYKRISIILLLIAIISPAGLLAQTGDSDIQSDSTTAEGFSISIDLRTGINALGIIPGVPVVVGVPITISSDTVRITPQLGFLYYFDVMSDMHNSYYIPFGVSFLYNPITVGVDVMYLQPVGGTNTNAILSTAVVSEFEIYKQGQFSLLFELKLGPSFIYDPAGTRVFTMVNCAFIPRYSLKN